MKLWKWKSYRIENQIENCNESERDSKLPEILIILAVALCVLTNGICSAWTSPTIPILLSNTSSIQMTFEETSYLIILSPLSRAIAAYPLSILTETIGRKVTILAIPIAQLASWTIVAFAQEGFALYIARIIDGIEDGAFSVAVSVYVAEIATPRVRSSWANFLVVFAFLGMLLVNAIGSWLSIRATAFVLASLSAINFLVFLFVPESPYFYLVKNKEDEARKSLRRLRWKNDVEEELKTIKEGTQRQLSEGGKLRDLFVVKSNRKALLVALGARALQEFSGIHCFFFYTQYIFQQTGSDLSESASAIIFTGFCVLTSIFGAMLVGRIGRRRGMIISCSACSVLLFAEATFFYLKDFTTVDTSTFSWLPLMVMVLFVCAMNVGLGIVPLVLLGELFSASVKGKSMFVLCIAYSVFLMVPSYLFQVMTDSLGVCAPFCFFGVCTFMGVLFSCFVLPETKDKSLEEIQMELRR